FFRYRQGRLVCTYGIEIRLKIRKVTKFTKPQRFRKPVNKAFCRLMIVFVHFFKEVRFNDLAQSNILKEFAEKKHFLPDFRRLITVKSHSTKLLVHIFAAAVHRDMIEL